MTANENGNFGNNWKQNEGNTIPRFVPSKYWAFTLNNWSKEELETLETILSEDEYIIGKEVGDSGTPHLQGYVSFKKKVRPMEKIKNPRIHWEKCKGNREQNINYCSKDKDFVTNIKLKKPLKVLLETQLYPWQRSIIDIISSEPDDRTIHWFWEANGCTGKTTFAKYLSHKFGAIPLEGKKNDILYCAAMFESDLYIWDLERCMEEYVSYGALEKIKNGYFMCSKYESKPIIRNSPHVIVFANFAPDIKNLSKDRWNIVSIEN